MAGPRGPSVGENPPVDSAPGSILEVEPLMRDYEAALSAAGSKDYQDQASKSNLYLFLLTLSMGGLETVWSAQHSNGSPFLASLGMSKALLAFVWVAGPITGIIAQPYIGIRSDNCRISWGKRKPFMVGCGALTVVFLLALAWVREISGFVTGIFGIDAKSEGAKMTTIVFATILVYCLDFSINSVQAAIRAFIVDNAPSHQQELANAWGSRIACAGSIFSYVIGYMDLPKVLPMFGNTQFKVLSVIAGFSLSFTVLISCSYIRERDPRNDPPALKNLGIISCCTLTFKYIPRLSQRIRRVCWVQFAAWCGWFPFLFYSTLFIGQLYVNPIFEKDRDLPDDKINKIWEEATRIGTFALLLKAIISLIASVALPLLITPADKEIDIPAIGADIDPGIGISTENDEADNNKTNQITKRDIFSKLAIPGLTLKRAWLLSHVLFATCMFSTIFISSTQAGSVILGIVGVSWAVTMWAPFAFISAEVSRFNTAETHSPNGYVDDEEKAANQAGIVLGVHNICVSFPQVISTLISSGIFKALQKPRGQPGDDSVGWVLRFAGCAALVAAFLTNSLEII